MEAIASSAATIPHPSLRCFGSVPPRPALCKVADTFARDDCHNGVSPRMQNVSAVRLGWGMVAAELAMASVLLAGAGLMIQTLRNLNAVNLGYRPDGVLAVSMN